MKSMGQSNTPLRSYRILQRNAPVSYERVRKVAESGQAEGIVQEYRKRVLSKARFQERKRK